MKTTLTIEITKGQPETITGIQSAVSDIKQDMKEGRTTLSEAIEQLKYIDYDQSALYNALFTTYNMHLYIY